MEKMRPRRTTKIIVSALASAGLVFGGVAGGMAIAGHTGTHVAYSGKSVVAKKVVTEAQYRQFTGTTWKALPGSTVSFSVPSGATRLVVAGLTGESQCTGGTPGTSWCKARVVARKSGSTSTLELNPKSLSPDVYAFDSVSGSGDDYWEGHAMNRATTLGAGTWRVWVEVSTTGDDTTFWLDDWFFGVDVLTQ